MHIAKNVNARPVRLSRYNRSVRFTAVVRQIGTERNRHYYRTSSSSFHCVERARFKICVKVKLTKRIGCRISGNETSFFERFFSQVGLDIHVWLISRLSVINLYLGKSDNIRIYIILCHMCLLNTSFTGK